MVFLDSVAAKLSSGECVFQAEAEDVHSEERLLVAEIGEVAGKLHTARSRNDQVLLSKTLFAGRGH